MHLIEGVFQISNEDLITSQLDNLSSTNSETQSIWTETQIKGISPIVICTFYRPPKDPQVFQFDELDQALSKLGNKINTQNIIIMADFNLPNIDLGNHAINPNSGYSTVAANKLLTIMEEHGLTQHVRIPTHTQGNYSNILDLVLTNRPDLIKKLSVVDDMADHNTIVIDINISPKRKCRPKRKMFIRSNADNASILKHLDNFNDKYRVLNDNMTVNPYSADFFYFVHFDISCCLGISRKGSI